LLRRGHQTQIAIGGDSVPVENYLHGCILLIHKNGMIGAVVEKYAEALGIEITLVVYFHGEIRAGEARSSHHGEEEKHLDSREHRSNYCCLALI
jgi:hypothetical protein